MKVSNNKIGSTSLGRTDAAAGLSKEVKTKGPTASGKEAVKDSANVNVSERAQMMQKAKDIASRPDTIDEAKVARLQKMIDEGKYKVDADAIADRLVDEHLQIPD